MAGMQLIRHVQEWSQYALAFAEEHQFDVEDVDWGSGPRMYPCLVASILCEAPRRTRARRKVATCFVYPPDAMALLDVTTAVTAPSAAPAEVPGHTQQEFAMRTAALLQAIVREMVSVGVTTPERFEKTFVASLAEIDRYHAADKEAAAQIQSQDTSGTLRKLFP